jgi:hypothetical protein
MGSPASSVTSLADLRGFAPSESWDGCESELEGALEGWIEAIAKADARSGVQAALACAELALPVVRASAQASADDVGGPDQSWGDSKAPVEQLAAARAWLGAGTAIPPHTADYTRQLNVWDEDLRPVDADGWFVYYVEATNLLVMAILHDDQGGPYRTWPRARCAARSAVCSYKAMHRPDDDRDADLARVIGAVRVALGLAPTAP